MDDDATARALDELLRSVSAEGDLQVALRLMHTKKPEALRKACELLADVAESSGLHTAAAREALYVRAVALFLLDDAAACRAQIAALQRTGWADPRPARLLQKLQAKERDDLWLGSALVAGIVVAVSVGVIWAVRSRR